MGCCSYPTPRGACSGEGKRGLRGECARSGARCDSEPSLARRPLPGSRAAKPVLPDYPRKTRTSRSCYLSATRRGQQPSTAGRPARDFVACYRFIYSGKPPSRRLSLTCIPPTCRGLYNIFQNFLFYYLHEYLKSIPSGTIGKKKLLIIFYSIYYNF